MFRFLFQPRSLFIFIFIMASMVILVGFVHFSLREEACDSTTYE